MCNAEDIKKRMVFAERDILCDGERLEIDDNTVMNNKRLVFSCDLGNGFSEGAMLKVGHGEDCYAATWVELRIFWSLIYGYGLSRHRIRD